jgi:hypothetical protein
MNNEPCRASNFPQIEGYLERIARKDPRALLGRVLPLSLSTARLLLHRPVLL